MTKKKKVRLTAKIKKEIKEIISLLNKEKKILQAFSDAKVRAFELLKEGHIIEGWLLATSKGNRSWKKDVDASKIYEALKKWISKKSDIELDGLKSPAAVEKLIIEDAEAVGILSKFTERADNGEALGADKEFQKGKKK